MHLFTIKFIISFFLFQSYINFGNSEIKISIADSFDNGMLLPHSPIDTIPTLPSQPRTNKKPLVKANKPLSDEIPPLPSPPPINKKWLVKASKLASDYRLNRSLADKKYKNGSLIVIEGILKEIKEPGEHGIIIIVLDGGPSKIDVQCEVLNGYKIKNLKKGMKATLNAHCYGLNGHVILSGCIYIEKPTYE